MSIQVTALAELQHCGKTISVELENVQKRNYSGVLQGLVDVEFARCVLHIAGFLRFTPTAVQLVHLDCNLQEVVQVVRLAMEKMLLL